MVDEMVRRDKSGPRRRRKNFLCISDQEAEAGERTLAGQGRVRLDAGFVQISTAVKDPVIQNEVSGLNYISVI